MAYIHNYTTKTVLTHIRGYPIRGMFSGPRVRWGRHEGRWVSVVGRDGGLADYGPSILADDDLSPLP